MKNTIFVFRYRRAREHPASVSSMCLATVLVLALGSALPAATTDTAPANDLPTGVETQGQSVKPVPYMELFEKAAAEFRVPVEILLVMGYQATRWDQMPGVRSNVGGYGIMGLHENPDHKMYQVTEAAKLLGLSPEELKLDAGANIRGAAVLLRRIADGLSPVPDTRIESWWPVFRKFRNFTNPYAIYADLQDFAGFLRKGAELPDPTGKPIRLKPTRPDFAKQLAELHARVKETTSDKTTLDLGVLTADYGPALWVPCASCNYSSRSSGVDTAVVHIMCGYYTSTINWCRDNCISASWHYAVRSSDGEVTQQVSESLKAWHASCWNSRSVGVEHEGWYETAERASIWFTEAMYASSGQLFRHFCDTYGLAREHRVNNTAGGIAGHNDLWNCNDHGDPGAYWDWPRFINYVNGSTPSDKCCCNTLLASPAALTRIQASTPDAKEGLTGEKMRIVNSHVLDTDHLAIRGDLTVSHGGQLILPPNSEITVGGNLNIHEPDGIVAQGEPFRMILTGSNKTIFSAKDLDLWEVAVNGQVRQMLKPGCRLRVHKLTVAGSFQLGPGNGLDITEAMTVEPGATINPVPRPREGGGWVAESLMESMPR